MRSNFVLCCSLLLLAIQCLAVTHTPNWAKYHEAELKPGAEGSLVVSTHKAGSGITMPLDVKENVKVTYTMEVRGEGQVSPYLSGGHGWYYGKKVALDSQNWTKVSITYATHYHKVTLMLVSAASEATFEVRNLQVDEAKPDELTEADMPPQLFCATDFPGSNGVSKKIQGALNGNAIWASAGTTFAVCQSPPTASPCSTTFTSKGQVKKAFRCSCCRIRAHIQPPRSPTFQVQMDGTGSKSVLWMPVFHSRRFI